MLLSRILLKLERLSKSIDRPWKTWLLESSTHQFSRILLSQLHFIADEGKSNALCLPELCIFAFIDPWTWQKLLAILVLIAKLYMYICVYIYIYLFIYFETLLINLSYWIWIEIIFWYCIRILITKRWWILILLFLFIWKKI